MMTALVVSSLFGATAALALPAAGGVGVAPAYVMLGFLVLQIVISRRVADMLLAPLHVPGGVCLTFLVGWGALSAVFVPRLFEGVTQISSLDRSSSGVVTEGYESLHSVSGNITQTGYAVAALIGFSAMILLLRTERGYEKFQRAMIILALLTALSALLDLLGFYVMGFDPLSIFKTAGYVVFNETELAGMKRISGTFSEASSYASFSLVLCAFCFELYLQGVKKKLMRFVCIMLLLFLLLSTSTTAYTALLIYSVILMTHAGLRMFSRAEMNRFSVVGGSLLALIFTVVFLVMLSPLVHDRVNELLYTVILTKGQSESGVARAMLNANAWQAFVDTWGVGVGLGSSRASSYVLVLLSNIGIPGVVLYCLWLSRIFTAEKNPTLPTNVAATVSASRWAIVAALISASISASVFDVGLLFYFLCAASVAHVMLFERVTGSLSYGGQHVLKST